jgi:hypothetical protein
MATSPRGFVPLLGSATTSQSPWLLHHGGPVLSNVKVEVIFWGAWWQQTAQVGLTTNIANFFVFILNGRLMDLLAEYGVSGYPIGHGQYSSSTIIATPGFTNNSVSDTDIKNLLSGPSNANTLYFVYLPPGVVFTSNAGASCADYCGYHGQTGSSGFYAVVPYPNCAGCSFGSNIGDSLTAISSALLCNAVTNPAGNGWYDKNSPNSEVATICNGYVATFNGFRIHAAWSNRLHTCDFSSHWDTGFSGFAAAPRPSGYPYVWAYRASDGTVCIHEINVGMTGLTQFTQKTQYKWDKGFSNFVGFSFSGMPCVWAYRASDGTTCIHQMTGVGNGFTQKSLYKWDTGFSGFAAVVDGSGTTYVWAYRASDGTTCIHQITGTGSGFTQKALYKWDKGFSSFVGFSLAGIPYVWAYRASDGTTCIHQITGTGNGFIQQSLSKWDTGFSDFAAAPDPSGIPYVWAYRTSDGTVCIHTIASGGRAFKQKALYKWDIGFSGFVGFLGPVVGQAPLVWAYKSANGMVCIHAINTNASGPAFTQVFID